MNLETRFKLTAFHIKGESFGGYPGILWCELFCPPQSTHLETLLTWTACDTAFFVAVWSICPRLVVGYTHSSRSFAFWSASPKFGGVEILFEKTMRSGWRIVILNFTYRSVVLFGASVRIVRPSTRHNTQSPHVSVAHRSADIKATRSTTAIVLAAHGLGSLPCEYSHYTHVFSHG